MRDVNDDSNSSSWPLFYGDKQQPLTNNGHYYNGFIPKTTTDAYPGLRQKMIEHEAIFKNQVYELHRLYRRQRDMMEEYKRKEYHNKHRICIDTSSSSSLLPSEDGQKWQIPSFPLTNSNCARPSIFGADISNSPLSCSKRNNKDCEITECRASKVRKKLFDLELPPDENIDNEDQEEMEASSYKDASFGQCFRGSNGLADLNEPVHVEEQMARGPLVNPIVGSTHEPFEKPISGRVSGALNPLLLDGRDWFSNTCQTGNSRSSMNFTRGTNTPFPNSRTTNSYPYMKSTDLGNYWGKPNGSLTHKLTSFQKQPSFLSSPQNHAVLGDKWRVNGCYTPNGFYQGSSSGSKDPYTRVPSGGFDQQKIFKGSNFIDLTDTTNGIDLNKESNQTVPPWLLAKPAIICKNDSIANNGKLFGFPVFGNSCVSKNESSSPVSTSASLRFPENGKMKTEMENRGFDINVALDDPANKQIDSEDCNLEKIKNNFDLNSCLTEDEDILVPEKMKKITMEIDLEAPFVQEVEEEEEAINEIMKIDSFDNDESFAKVAAVAIVAMAEISSQQDQAGSTSDVATPSDDNEHLLLLANIIENAGFFSNKDEYEELTLQLELTKEKDYMPTPLAPDFQEPKEPGPLVGPFRPRRGQTRRGRPRRDFQRDILPGLASLSRHEVTEDL